MADRVASHYSENLKLADAIAEKLRGIGKNPNKLTAADLAIVDAFHIRGRKATLELGEKMKLNGTMIATVSSTQDLMSPCTCLTGVSLEKIAEFLE